MDEKVDGNQVRFSCFRKLLILESKKIGTCGFEPQTPTVSRWAEVLPTPSTITNQPKTKPRGRRKSRVEAVKANGSREKVGKDTHSDEELFLRLLLLAVLLFGLARLAARGAGSAIRSCFACGAGRPWRSPAGS